MKLTSLFSLAVLALGGTAFAQEASDDAPPPPPQAPSLAPAGIPPVVIPISPNQPLPPPSSLPPNVHVGPDGGVDVHRTPEQGVDVHAQTDAGTVHAYSCSRVQLDPRTAQPGSNVAPPPPQPACPAPYPYPYAYPYAYYPPPAYYSAYYYPPPVRKPKYAPDPTRTGLLIASSLVFGLGTAAAGGAYVSSISEPCSFDASGNESCAKHGSQAALWSMGGFLTFTPSIPRLAMGDVGVGVLLTALRGGSFVAGAAPSWGEQNAAMPVMFAFVIPMALGVVNLALTPHREQMDKRAADQAARDANRFRLKSLAPAVARDDRGNTIKTLAAGGTF